MSYAVQLGLAAAISIVPIAEAPGNRETPTELYASVHLQKEWIDLEGRGHSSGIVKGPEGMIVATTGRTLNTEPKSLLIYREVKGKWTKETFYTPQVEGEFCSSPVICNADPSNPSSKDYLLFFRVGTQANNRATAKMRSYMYRSTNGGATFVPEALPAGIIGPTKCKPLAVGNYLVFGSSTEKTGANEEKSTAARIEIYDRLTKQWHQSPELNGDNAFGAIEPTFCTFIENEQTYVRMLCRNRSKGCALTAVFTLPKDPAEGFTWPAKLVDSTLPNCDSGLDVVNLPGQDHVVFAFGNFLESRDTLELAVSTDGGTKWSAPVTIDKESGEFPACIFDEETGLIHVTYASKAPNNPDDKDLLSIRHCSVNPMQVQH